MTLNETEILRLHEKVPHLLDYTNYGISVCCICQNVIDGKPEYFNGHDTCHPCHSILYKHRAKE